MKIEKWVDNISSIGTCQLSIVTGIVLLAIGISSAFAGQTFLQSVESDFQAIVQSARPAVVEVVATHTVPVRNIPQTTGKFFVENTQETIDYKNIGSGTFIGLAGHIVTTSAVVEGAEEIEVVFADGRRNRAKLRGIDSLTGIAVLAVEDDYPRKTKIGDSDQIRPGAWVVTVGSSYGYSPTLSFGIVSGLEILPNRPFYDVIKFNAAVNPGNSGGAVVNTSGEIVGIITAILAEPYFTPSPDDILGLTSPNLSGEQPSIARPTPIERNVWMGNEIGFAIPIKTVQAIAKQLIQYGEVRRGWLGVRIEQDPVGVRVTKVLENTPAQKAGIFTQDVITEFDNTPVHTSRELQKLVADSAPNMQVTIKIRRGQQELQRNVVLGERK